MNTKYYNNATRIHAGGRHAIEKLLNNILISALLKRVE